MANPEHLALLREWTLSGKPSNKPPVCRALDLSGEDLRSMNLSNLDLSHADLSFAKLADVKLIGTKLFQSNLLGADLSRGEMKRVNLYGAILAKANLYRTNLLFADLRKSDLKEANLCGSRLQGANFGWADLTSCDLREACLEETLFPGTTLKYSLGLDLCNFTGPCSIDLDAIEKSWPIPLSFLRGCGLPESLIEYLPALISDPKLFYSLFISYSTADNQFAKRLHADLQHKGVRCWFAPHDIQGGRKLHEQIDQAIRVYDRLLLILSEHSMSSNWVKTEIANARQREANEGKRVLFPIRLVDFEAIKGWSLFDADTGIDSAREIREYFIPDFSNWTDDDSYKKAFERLLRDLKAET